MKKIRSLLVLLVFSIAGCVFAGSDISSQDKKPVAGIVADWFKYSHPDVILTRIFKTYSLDGKGEESKLKLVSVYRDKPSERDLSRLYAEQYGFKIYDTIEDALTCATGKLAVNGVIISTEWCDYPVSPTGQIMYPHKRMFEEVVKVFEKNKKVVPVFIDKHIADNWTDIKWIYNTAKKMKIPLMAGSSVPVAWRYPPVDVDKHSKLKEIVGISYHTLDGYGFHGMEMVQCLAEQRKGGETGIKSVQCITGQNVWDSAGKMYDPVLLNMAVEKLGRKIPEGKSLKDLVPQPVLFVMNYYDGLRVCLFTLNGIASQWTAAWKYSDGKTASTIFKLDDNLSTLMHFANQMKGIENMILTRKPSWPVERTVLTSGALDALLISKSKSGKIILTPYLRITYNPFWHWEQPAGTPQ
ncbi:MAG TPA: hypothetical protein P5065_05700 [Candidatus Ratteibacteria bacterium]|jgi:hypothetical protein|nr:hypothetical protein [bacterium]HRS06515.1 hypothetical protein [Candidatus Ratteibacteria bacterium]HON05929.1 hypothetical protein [bacterium]HOQ82226.1 hypothetical protein [bacterium]HPC28889.1 hypothetical protein [bacterium]